jgi:hypothetical protein
MQPHTTEQRKRLHRNCIAALDLLDTLKREPDRWEEECLSYALSAMACGLYLVAEVELEAFGRPIVQRSREAMAALDAKPQRFTKLMLRHGLEFVLQREGQPDLEMPHAFAVIQPDFRASLS